MNPDEGEVARYRLRGSVTARRYLPDGSNQDAILEWVGGHRAGGANQLVGFDSPESPSRQFLEPGDWVVRMPGGSHVKQDRFTDFHERVPDEPAMVRTEWAVRYPQPDGGWDLAEFGADNLAAAERQQANLVSGQLIGDRAHLVQRTVSTSPWKRTEPTDG